jgi:hypothetical protein
MNRIHLLGALIGIIIGLAVVDTAAQTNPTPFNLAAGNYSFTAWNNTEPAGTYPASMVFHVYDQRIEPFAGLITDAPNGDWIAPYNLTGGPRINGEGANGVSFFQTGSGQSSNNCAFLGAAVLALNTTGRVNVQTTMEMQVTSTGTRPYVMRLQYRYNTGGTSYTNWTNAIGADGNFVELNSVTAGTANQTSTWMAPLELENRANVQLRWIYFQDGDGSGGRPRIRLDNITVSSDNPTASVPTALRVFQMPASPSAGVPFQMLIRPVDGSGRVCNVTTTTNVLIGVQTGTGSVSGTTSGSITTNALTLTGVSYSKVENGVVLSASATSGMALTAGTVTRNFGEAAAYAVMSGSINRGYAGIPLKSFTVTVYRRDNTVDVSYTNPITVFLQSGVGSLSGTLTVTPFRGVATFDNVMASSVGNVTIGTTIPGLPTKILPTIQILTAPKVTGDIVPQYINGRFSSGTCSYSAFITPSYARVTFTGLQPNSSYRFNVGAGNTMMSRPSSTGGGFNIHYNASTNTYDAAGGKSLNTDGEYSNFSTGSTETTRTIWINLLPTNSDAFDPTKIVYWQIALGDESGNLIDIMQLTQTSIPMDNNTTSTTSTLIGDLGSQLTTKNYVVLYDNTAGTGRPLGVALVQPYNTSINFATNRYRFDIENVSGAWMTQVPNTLPTGVRRIEERDYRSGAVTYAVTSNDGIWNGINTNPLSYGTPGGFSTPIYLKTPKVTVSKPAAGDTLCAGSIYRIQYRADGMSTVALDYSTNGGVTWSEIDPSEVATKGWFDWSVPAVGFQGNVRIRVRGVDRPETGTSTAFAIVDPLVLIQELQSSDLCLDDNDTLIAFVGGSIESYQWYKDGVPIPNQNGPFLYITDAHYQTAGVYWCVIDGYGSCGRIETNKAHVRVARPTQIAWQTRAVAGIIGERVSMEVRAEFPSEVRSYQWYKGQTMLTDDGHYYGTTSNRLEIIGFTMNDYGNDYHCVVNGICGSVDSRVIRVFPTGVYAEFRSENINACTGQDVDLVADVYSNPPGEDLVIRWYRNGIMLSEGGKFTGTNSGTLTINNVTTADAGVYTVKAHLALNSGVAGEASATVVIATTPTISQQPSAAAVCEGAGASLSVVANAQGTITYQWFLDGTAVPGATSASYTIQTMTAARAGIYTVAVTTACGSVTSQAAAVTMKNATVITQQPVGTVDVQAGQPFQLTVAATGSGTLQYQWFKDGAELTGEVAPAYNVSAAQASDAGEYYCRVTSECGPVNSDTTSVTIRPVTSVDNDVYAGGLMISAVAPNPASSDALVSVSLAHPARVTMTLIDASGSAVATIVDAELQSGEYGLTIDTGMLSSGVYMLNTVSGSTRHVQSIIVVK